MTTPLPTESGPFAGLGTEDLVLLTERSERRSAKEGEEIYQEEYSKLCDMVLGIDEGLVRRSLIEADRLTDAQALAAQVESLGLTLD